MLPKAKKLIKDQFTTVIEKGQAFHSPFFILKISHQEGNTRFGVSVPKKVAKTAVSRNKFRRQAYSIVGHFIDEIADNLLVVLVFKTGSEKLKFHELQEEIDKIFVKSGIIQ